MYHVTYLGLKRSHMYGNIDVISSPQLRQSGILKTSEYTLVTQLLHTTNISCRT